MLPAAGEARGDAARVRAAEPDRATAGRARAAAGGARPDRVVRADDRAGQARVAGVPRTARRGPARARRVAAGRDSPPAGADYRRRPQRRTGPPATQAEPR